MVKLKITCRVCGEVHTVQVKEEDLVKYNNGEYAQRAFPYLSADERELIISRTCPQCWTRIFGNEE